MYVTIHFFLLIFKIFNNKTITNIYIWNNTITLSKRNVILGKVKKSITTKHRLSLNFGGVMSTVLKLCPFTYGKQCWIFCFCSFTLVCINQMLWNIYTMLISIKIQIIYKIWAVSLFMFLSYILFFIRLYARGGIICIHGDTFLIYCFVIVPYLNFYTFKYSFMQQFSLRQNMWNI